MDRFLYRGRIFESVKEPTSAQRGSRYRARQHVTVGGRPYAPGDELPSGPVFDGPPARITVKPDRAPDLEGLVKRGLAEKVK